MRAVRVVLCGLVSLALLMAGFAPPVMAATIRPPASPVRAVAQPAPRTLPTVIAPASVLPPGTEIAAARPTVAQLFGLGAGPSPRVDGLKAFVPMTSGGWTVSLAVTGTSTLTLTATVNQPLDGTGQWLEIFDTSSTGTVQYVKYCNTGTVCAVDTVPYESQSTYIAVVGNTITNTYAGYPASSASAWSNQVTPPAWTVTLTANITATIGLTATSNYAATGTSYLEIFDTTKVQSGTTYLNYCNSGTSCSATTVPEEPGASYVAVVTHGPPTPIRRAQSWPPQTR